MKKSAEDAVTIHQTPHTVQTARIYFKKKRIVLTVTPPSK